MNESYWTYRAPRAVPFEQLPSGIFNGDKAGWESLSPGMRKEIVRSYLKNVDPLS